MNTSMKLKAFVATAAIACAWTIPASAETSAAELFAMSNSSAAEIIVREGSMGDITSARIMLALGNMSAAEREAFFQMNNIDRMKILEKAKLFGDGNSAAEMSAAIMALENN